VNDVPAEATHANDRRYKFLASVFTCLGTLYLLMQLLRTWEEVTHAAAAGRSAFGALVEAVLNNPLLTLPVCGICGAAIAQMPRSEDQRFSLCRALCLIYVGGVAGLLAPTLVTLGWRGAEAPALTLVAIVAGCGGERFFAWLTRKVLHR
jgi:hypothetical protein